LIQVLVNSRYGGVCLSQLLNMALKNLGGIHKVREYRCRLLKPCQ
jgi:hypothetical protein